MNIEEVKALVRMTMHLRGIGAAEAVNDLPFIPEDMKDQVIADLVQEEADAEVLRVRDARVARDETTRQRAWLRHVDRETWYYWPRLRAHLRQKPAWTETSIRSLDESTDKILACLADPQVDTDFDVRGLVVGYVQSGKTANYSALIAKAADAGYRLVIVLTGIHDSLRQQTQRRLDAELVGRGRGAVPRPADAQRWITFTLPHLKGDFSAGGANTAALGSGLPALIVMKKHRAIFRRLNHWLEDLSATMRRMPVLVIDDEADQASVNTKGNRPPIDEDMDELDDSIPEGTAPSVINGLIRQLLTCFPRVAYVAYTATPFANVLIDHRAEDRDSGRDLYPANFIVDLPEPAGYYGPERIFGSDDDADDPGMNVIRRVRPEDSDMLVPKSRSDAPRFDPAIPDTLVDAIDDFVLAGAARMQREDCDIAATMLVHATPWQAVQGVLSEKLELHVARLRDDWRYNRRAGLEQRLRTRWTTDFVPTTRTVAIDKVVSFDKIQPYITNFLESETGQAPLDVLQINSSSEDILDYERDPTLKSIVVGGNRLSRGLTLEGLLISYYVRVAGTYDTLMQMGRWFGFRDGYADLTRIYTTAQLEMWFRFLVSVEASLREDIRQYAQRDLTPLDVGVRIRSHPALLVTDRLKMRDAEMEKMSFDGDLVQTFMFPFDDLGWLRRNVEATREFVATLGSPTSTDKGQPMWRGIPWERVVSFLERYGIDSENHSMPKELLIKYVRRQAAQGELTEWIVGIMGQAEQKSDLGAIDLGIVGGTRVNAIMRSKLEGIPSLKTITSPSDQALGLTEAQMDEARSRPGKYAENLRGVRSKREGLLLIYPISKHSGWKNGVRETPERREPIFPEPGAGEDVIGVALAFPQSDTAATVEYVVGTVGAKVDDDDFLG